ncbi:hypothetical protein [Bradyrhizobium sp. McL0615]|uniref:hypothetical protein n=1 Tax=Bradyrhizobium sp. McL0615 TaxID=3415673 RepID=UPI003CF5F22C
MMRPSLHIALQLPDITNVRATPRTYDPETEDIRSILSDLCRTVAKEGKFVVAGFGQDRWPVDVGTDLAILLEQLPDVLRAVKAGAATEIDFYEQGIERKIEFSPAGNAYNATCISQTEWQPNPAVEQVGRAVLEGMLVGVQEEVVRLIEEIAPDLAEHDWVRRWRDAPIER